MHWEYADVTKVEHTLPFDFARTCALDPTYKGFSLKTKRDGDKLVSLDIGWIFLLDLTCIVQFKFNSLVVLQVASVAFVCIAASHCRLGAAGPYGG